jgi:MFS family permease
MYSNPKRVLAYAIAATVFGCAFGIASSFIFRPLSDWWFGEFTWVISLIISIILSILVFLRLADENLTLAPAIVSALMTPVGTIIATTGILLAANVIFGVAFAIIGLRAFSWGISGLTPTESERLMGSIFSIGVIIGGVLVFVIAVVLIFFLAFLICTVTIEPLIREKAPEERPPKQETTTYVS